MAYSSTPLLQVCTRCRVRSLIRDLRISRLPQIHPSSRFITIDASNGAFPSSRTSRTATQTVYALQGAQRREFTAFASPLLLQAGEKRLRRKPGHQRINPVPPEEEDAVESEDVEAELPLQQQLWLMEMLYSQGRIELDEWRSAVFSQIGVQNAAADTAEDDRILESRVRQLRESYGVETVVPDALLKREEKKVWERLFGSGSLRALEDAEMEDLVEDEEDVGTGLLRESGNGLEEVEYEDEDLTQERYISGDERLADDIRKAMAAADGAHDEGVLGGGEENDDVVTRLKTHPLTIANRFGTNPTTLQLPKSEIVDPISTALAGISSVHIAETANRVFGGHGLPYSTSTPHRGKLMQQKPIPLDVYQSLMSPIEGDVYMATIFPGIYASVVSVLTETRKRLGTAWAEQLVRKASEGTLKILDAGGAGAGVLAVREMLRAEWERMHEDNPHKSTDIARVDGRVGGSGASPPLGSATVLTGSDTLRRRASQLLGDTSFIPRLPDYVHTEEAKMQGKFDLVIAPHTLWQLREDHVRKIHVQNLWSLCSASGGVLVLLEKGIPRGFELIAGAREMLLNTRVANPNGGEDVSEEVQPLSRWENAREPGTIIAPCTNHSSCPLYHQKGIVRGRRDICSFAQRYHRPPFLQQIFGTRGRNHEDVEFSYLSIMRGQDLREQQLDGVQQIRQDAEATDRAFRGYVTTPNDGPDGNGAEAEPLPHSLSLPRSVFPPMKRKGHVIIDVCTPSGTLERWTVPRSFSKQAFHDARKSVWGDLWALGAKTRVPRNIKDGLAKADMDVKGHVVSQNQSGRKVRGIRDKRDKKGTGNGRRKYQEAM